MRWWPGLLPLLLCIGCAGTRPTVMTAFPPGSLATPWILRDAVWTGSFDEAAPALGDDADAWRKFGAGRVWLAIYCHETNPEQCLTVRCFAFESADAARKAYDALSPLAAKPFQAGDVGCWTEIGVLFQWGRLVFDVFGRNATFESQVQSTYLVALLTKRMPPGAPDDPQ
jgi:hypothetical protein